MVKELIDINYNLIDLGIQNNDQEIPLMMHNGL